LCDSWESTTSAAYLSLQDRKTLNIDESMHVY
jgi:hypothetical protein